MRVAGKELEVYHRPIDVQTDSTEKRAQREAATLYREEGCRGTDGAVPAAGGRPSD